jgi:hypothetical protein
MKVSSWCGTNDCNECDVCKLVEENKKVLGIAYLIKTRYEKLRKEVIQVIDAELGDDAAGMRLMLLDAISEGNDVNQI